MMRCDLPTIAERMISWLWHQIATLRLMIGFMMFSYYLNISEGNQCTGLLYKFTRTLALSTLFEKETLILPFDVTSAGKCASGCINNINCTSYYVNATTNKCMLYRYRLTANPGEDVLTAVKYFVMSEEACSSADAYVLHRQPSMCYKIHREMKTRAKAQNVCNENGGHLIDIDTMEKYNAVDGYLLSIGSKGRYYVAMNSMKVTGFWVWTDGTDNTLGPDLGVWNIGEPDDLSYQRCVAFGYPGSSAEYHNGFSDTECSDTVNFICVKTA